MKINKKGVVMNDPMPEEIAELLGRLIKNNEILGQKLIALTFVCAYILKEQCMTSGTPLVTLTRLEGELGGISEAIALQFATGSSDPKSNTGEITRLIESILIQANDAVTRAIERE
ncbi:MAG: hypothetical protein KDJ19_13055 [Hyphomicrobiaceae bacterium]|nr:hypothetical protein [Hyphomicrobiaceae bacterium]